VDANQSWPYAPSRVEVDKSEMHGIGLTDRDIQLSQSTPCPSVYEKMANVEDVRLNIVGGGVLFVVRIQWAAVDKEVVMEERQSKHRGGVAVHVSIRETFPALVDRYRITT